MRKLLGIVSRTRTTRTRSRMTIISSCTRARARTRKTDDHDEVARKTAEDENEYDDEDDLPSVHWGNL